MCSFVQAELSYIRAVLQKVSGSQIVRAYHQKWWYAFFLWEYSTYCSFKPNITGYIIELQIILGGKSYVRSEDYR